MKTYIISNDPVRAAACIAAASSLAPVVVAGIDPSSWSIDSPELRLVKDSHRLRGMTYGQVACSLAHVSLWKHVAEETESCLILEDDAILENGVETIWPDSEILFLHANPQEAVIPVGISEFARVKKPSTVAYRLAPSGAKSLLALFASDHGYDGIQLPSPIDLALGVALRHPQWDAKVFTPYPFRHVDNGVSTIANGNYIVAPPHFEDLLVERRKAMKLPMAEFRKRLVDRGIMPSRVDAAIAAIVDEVARTKAQIDWEYQPEVRRTSPLVVALAPAFGLSEEQVDAVFQ